MNELSRRHAIEATGLGLLSLPFIDHSTDAAEAPRMEPFNRFPRMVQEHFVRRLRVHDDIHRNRILAIKSKAQAQAYVNDVQRKIQLAFGPWPAKTPLKPRVTKVLKRDGFRIENVIFESRPGFLVTANLYLPENTEKPVPGVVGTCGHSSNGKQAEPYQAFAQGLARLGYACLIYDPIGQGERLQYVTDDLKAVLRPGTAEHIHAGNQQILLGEFFGSWRAWDGIRALDYLLTRPEVDKNHLGVTGNSGGGTMTTWLAGVENRWTMAAPSCFVTTFRRNLENELPADSEQCPPRVLALGLDHCDFLAALAPRPVVVLAKEKDYFDARGAEEAYARLRHLYRALGAEENVRLFIGPTYHGFSQENREAMYSLFNFATEAAQSSTEPTITQEKDETLWCTPNGQVAGLGSKTVFQFASESSKNLAKSRNNPSGAGLLRLLTETLNMPEATGVPEYRILRPQSNRKYPTRYYANYLIETEPGVQAVLTMLSKDRIYSRPRTENKRAVLYVPHQSADADLREDPLIKEVLAAEEGVPFFACDVRGCGESQPDTCRAGSFLSPYGSDYFYSAHSIMLDQPYLGQKTFDLLRVLDWLKSLGHQEVHLVARGWGALAGTFASALSGQVKQVTLKNALTSYASVAETEHYHWPLSTLLPGVLLHFDLPDCYSELKQKQLRQIDPWGAKAGRH